MTPEYMADVLPKLTDHGEIQDFLWMAADELRSDVGADELRSYLRRSVGLSLYALPGQPAGTEYAFVWIGSWYYQKFGRDEKFSESLHNVSGGSALMFLPIDEDPRGVVENIHFPTAREGWLWLLTALDRLTERTPESIQFDERFHGVTT